MTHWESSNRPLFVRTIWKDGHHHMVLRKDEKTAPQTARSARRSASSGTSQSSGKKISPASECSVNFKVPSVKLLLASLRGFKNDTKMRRCTANNYARDFVTTALTIDIIPSDSVSFNDINKQVSFRNIASTDNRPYKISTKSNSVEVNQSEIGADGIVTPPPFSYDNYCLDQFNTTLSERVMIWLDLAIQNQKQFKNVDIKKRVVTAQACTISQRKLDVNKNHHKYKYDVERCQQIDQSKRDGSFLKHDADEKDAGPLLTSHMECDEVDEIDGENRVKKRSNTAKRQLHIFLPNLPKRTSENSSLLSSKGSSLFQTNKI